MSSTLASFSVVLVSVAGCFLIVAYLSGGISHNNGNQGSFILRRRLKTHNFRDVLAELCLSHNSSNIGACKSLCTRGACCFDEGDCDLPHGLECLDYIPCRIFYNETNPSDDDNVDEKEELLNEAQQDFQKEKNKDIAEGKNVGLTYEHIKQACELGLMSMPGKESACEKYCKPGECCFGDHQDCKDDVDCAMYIPCAPMITHKAKLKRASIMASTANAAPSGKHDEQVKNDEQGKHDDEVKKASNIDDKSTHTARTTETEEEHMNIDGSDTPADKSGHDGDKGGYPVLPVTPKKQQTKKQENDEDDAFQIEKRKVDEACKRDRMHCVKKCVLAACCYATEESEKCIWVNPEIHCEAYASCSKVFEEDEQESE